jgi:glycosyltransferase involved in cell wall biosynthesis
VSISNLWRADLLNVLSSSGERKVSILHAGVAGAAANVKLRRFRWLAAQVYRRFDRIVGVSPEIRKEAISLYGLSPSKVIHIPNAIEAAKPRQAAALVDVIWCGRFVDEKNPLGAVEVLRTVLAARPELRVAMIGDGPLLETSIRSCGAAASRTIELGRVAFLGAQDRAAELIASSRLLISTSKTESFGLVLGEAMTRGVPVLAADAISGGPHEVLGARTDHDPDRSSPERTTAGFLLPIPVPGTETIALWVNAIATVLDDPALHAELRDGALKRAAEFSPAKIDRAWEALLDQLS